MPELKARSGRPSVGAVGIALIATLVATTERAEAGPSPERIARLRSDIAAVLEQQGAPGVGIALVDRSGVLWVGGVGQADTASGRAVTADTLFRVGSITKSFVALGAVRLHEGGQLDLDAPLAALLPDVAMDNPWNAEAPVTLAHVLEHTAGFDDMRFNELEAHGGELEPLLDVLARNPRSRSSRWRPGSRASYANPGYTVAAAALERASGTNYRSLLAETVFSPLGMSDVHWQLSAPGVRERLATGYAGPDSPAPPLALAHHPAGALITTPGALGRFVHHWLRRSDAIASEDMRQRIERADTLPYGHVDNEYGLGNYGSIMFGARCRGHDGGLPGFVSTYRYCPALGIGYVVLSNQTYARLAHFHIERLVFAALSEETPVPAAPRAPESADERATLVGYYQFESPRHELVGFLERALVGVDIVDTGQHLLARPAGGGEAPLVRTGDSTYRLPFEGGTSVRFARDDDGRAVLLADRGYFVRVPRRAARARRAAVLGGWRVMTATLWAMLIGLALWFTSALVGRREAPRSLRCLVLPALSAGSLLAAIQLVLLVGVPALGGQTGLSIVLCALTVSHAAFAAAAVLDSASQLWRYRTFGLSGMSIPAVGFAASLVCASYATWLGSHGIIGLRTWAW